MEQSRKTTSSLNGSFETKTPAESARARRSRATLILLLLCALIITAALVFALKRQPAAEAAVTAVLPVNTESVAVEDGLLVVFLDVGQGDCAFLRSPSGKTMLVDGGPEGSFPAIDAMLRAYGVVGLDAVIASHLHADHIGGLIDVLGAYPVGAFYDPPFDAESETYYALLDALAESETVVSSPLAGANATIEWDSACEVRILAPYNTVYSDFNDTSYILRVSCGDTSVLLAGDATEVGERLALKALPNAYFQADVLKVGHHGAETGTSERFLSAVSPSIAVVSVGASNSYGLPDQALLDRLADYGVTVYRTDENGTITLLLDGTNVRVIE